MSVTPPHPHEMRPPPEQDEEGRRQHDAPLDEGTADADLPRATQGPPERTLPAKIGPYRILREIGAGGMGTVFLGVDAEGARLAIKVPTPECVADELSVRRFYREARSARRVEHPNVCRVRDVGRDGALFFLAMDWIEGETLAHVLRRGDAPCSRRSLELVATLAEALQAAHDAGIIHRDLKPSNVMLRPDGQPVIIDFGTARRFDNAETLLTLTGSIVGTPGYMAPEQVTAAAGDIGPACDVYALGVVLYELLTGAAPFSGSIATILGSIVSAPPPPLRMHRRELDAAVEAICLKALAKRPEDRFLSARQFAEAIAAYLREGPAAVARLLPESPDGRTSPPPAAGPGIVARWWSKLAGRW